MASKCIYCYNEIETDSVVDICMRCGHGVWGEKMFNAIRSGMEDRREKGDLHQGSVSEAAVESPKSGF